jgi:hypothetical protein
VRASPRQICPPSETRSHLLSHQRDRTGVGLLRTLIVVRLQSHAADGENSRRNTPFDGRPIATRELPLVYSIQAPARLRGEFFPALAQHSSEDERGRNDRATRLVLAAEII